VEGERLQVREHLRAAEYNRVIYTSFTPDLQL
jgi:hypothetical protein